MVVGLSLQIVLEAVVTPWVFPSYPTVVPSHLGPVTSPFPLDIQATQANLDPQDLSPKWAGR